MKNLLSIARWLLARFMDAAFDRLGYVSRSTLQTEQCSHEMAIRAAVQAHARADAAEASLAHRERILEQALSHQVDARIDADAVALRVRFVASQQSCGLFATHQPERRSPQQPERSWGDRRGPGGGGPR